DHARNAAARSRARAGAVAQTTVASGHRSRQDGSSRACHDARCSRRAALERCKTLLVALVVGGVERGGVVAVVVAVAVVLQLIVRLALARGSIVDRRLLHAASQTAAVVVAAVAAETARPNVLGEPLAPTNHAGGSGGRLDASH